MTQVIIKITVDGITTIGKEINEDEWVFNYEDGSMAFYIEKITEPDGSIAYEYEYADFPGEVQYISSTMFEGKQSIKDIAEWISGAYPY